MNNKITTLPIIESDEWLEPVAGEIVNRYQHYLDAMAAIGASDDAANQAIVDYANAHHFFGWQRDDAMSGWWFREWLPNACDVFIFGEFNNWQRTQHRLDRSANGVWSIFLPDALYADRLTHGSLYKIHVHGENGWLDRIPAYATRVVQDDVTKNYTAQFWIDQPFDWEGDDFRIEPSQKLLIYEAHVGMATEEEKVGTYIEFKDNILPLVKEKGYNTIQLMAIAEHPYYGSFGYHVSSLFAPSSRFGTPEELKELIRKAHQLGIIVIMDIVHAHYVKNINEGIAQLDGTSLYSPAGEAGYQPYWDSMNYDFARPEVRHMLLSNAKYWLEEFHFDGYRFDGVTSMIYHHHGYTKFDSRDKFFNEDVNRPALTYLTMANRLIHAFRTDAVTIAEDVSGMPGMCISVEDGGIGFDYRLAMSIPDFWIKLIKDQRDEEWSIWEIWDIMTSRLPSVKSIAYAESHDQAMVGDKTIAFRLMDAEMYTSMNRASESIVIDRGIALHKMIRLATITMGGDGYLNFMGNEFGHPEWIDFPREGNGWSYAYARRQWSLETNGFLRYAHLGDFDRALMELVNKYDTLNTGYPYRLQMDCDNRTMVYTVGDELLVVLNWHGEASIPEYECEVRFDGCYVPILSSDEERFGGFDRVEMDGKHFSFVRNDRRFIKVYNTSRTATVYKLVKD